MTDSNNVVHTNKNIVSMESDGSTWGGAGAAAFVTNAGGKAITFLLEGLKTNQVN